MLIDKTIPLMLDPYKYISKTCRELKSDAFETRLFLQKTICMTGVEASELFYNNEKIMRKGAAPRMLLATLLGKGGVQGLDDKEHVHRKDMFMSVMTDENVKGLGEIVTRVWLKAIEQKWSKMNQIIFYPEIQEILTEAVCAWAGVPLEKKDLKERTKELTHLFDSAGAKSLRHFKSRLSRKKTDNWIENLVLMTRKQGVKENTPFHTVVWHRDLKGELLPAHVAAVEVLNLLRPTVAVSVYMLFVAHALHLHPECRKKLKEGVPRYDDMFIQEIKRLYPFFPAMFARAKEDFTWKNIHFKKGVRVMLDIYGTNHDQRLWDRPEEFIPERYINTQTTPFNFVPQGGGSHTYHHRCPGEFIANELMRVTINILVFKLKYSLPEQDLEIDFKRTPSIPKDRLILTMV